MLVFLSFFINCCHFYVRLSPLSPQSSASWWVKPPIPPGERQHAVCDLSSSVSAAGVKPVLSAKRGWRCSLRGASAAEASAVWGAGWLDRLSTSTPHTALDQQEGLHVTWKPSHEVSSSSSLSHFFNAMQVTPVPRVEVTGPSPAWGSWPWVECLHLGPWLWKTLRKAVWHWAGLSTVSSWNRGAPKAFYVMSDANPELSSHEGAQPPNVVLVVPAICICGWCLHKPPSPASGSLSVSHLGS